MVRLLLAFILAFLPATGARAMTLPTIGVTIDGVTVTSQLQSATWNLGISDSLADLAPNTASLQFKGQLSVSPADPVVISAGGTAMWTGRLDTCVETRDVNGDYWSSVTATDLIGALGAAHLEEFTLPSAGQADDWAESLAIDAGVSLSAIDDSGNDLPSFSTVSDDPFTGSVLEYIVKLARASNAMVALQHDGQLIYAMRKAFAFDLVGNDSFDVNTTGWSNVGGGAISRVTASPYDGAGNARIVSSATIYSGADNAITYTFAKGHTYRLDFYARSISGSTSIIGGIGDQGAGDFNNAVKTLTGSWAQYLTDWTPTDYRTAGSVIFRNTAAASNTFEIDRVLVYEVANATDVSASIVTWEKTTSIDVDVNKWVGTRTVLLVTGPYTIGSDAGDITTYGERTFDAQGPVLSSDVHFDDWIAFGGSQRPVVTRGELIVTSSTSPLLALDPLDWVNDGTDDWQIMSMTWSAAPGEPWHLTITADNLIALL